MGKKSYQQFYKVTILCEIIVRVRVRVRVTVRVRVSMLSGSVLSVFSRYVVRVFQITTAVIGRVTAIVLNQTYCSSGKQFSTYQQKIHSFYVTRHFLVIETKLYACRCLKTNLLLFMKTVSYQRECLKLTCCIAKNLG